MKLLSLSNGHGEDQIAVQILKELQQQSSALEVAALPIVGEGHAYIQHQIPLAGPVQTMPSGGFIYMDRWQLARDLRGGLLQLTGQQLQTVWAWGRQGGAILAVGDIVPLLFAWWSGANYAFVGTAKSEYYLRNEGGWLPQVRGWQRLEGWSGSVYHPWERWLMGHRRCRAVFPRDRLTTQTLNTWAIPAFDLGNPMMDGLAPALTEPVPTPLPTVLLLPGSRPPEAYTNWQTILEAINGLVQSSESMLFLAAIAPGLDLKILSHHLQNRGWHPTSQPHLRWPDPQALTFAQEQATLVLTQHTYNDCLHRADLAIAMAGTATEQFVGLGKPVISLPGNGPQFTPAFAEAQTRLLGPSVTLVAQPSAAPQQVRTLLHDQAARERIARNGRSRLGEPGAARRIAACLQQQLLMHKEH